MGKVGLIDYGAGNFASVKNALLRLGREVVEVREPSALGSVSHIILPGVGAFAAAMSKVESLGIADALREHVAVKGKPYLGICVGMQILADAGYEFGEHGGLGFIHGRVDRMDAAAHGLRLPHIGWNDLDVKRRSPLFEGMEERPIFYFVHSYMFHASDEGSVAATCGYGSEVTAAVSRDNVFGVQFHPEKSQRDGLRLLGNFASL